MNNNITITYKLIILLNNDIIITNIFFIVKIKAIQFLFTK